MKSIFKRTHEKNSMRPGANLTTFLCLMKALNKVLKVHLDFNEK
jgi:hypothetical protein